MQKKTKVLPLLRVERLTWDVFAGLAIDDGDVSLDLAWDVASVAGKGVSVVSFKHIYILFF